MPKKNKAIKIIIHWNFPLKKDAKIKMPIVKHSEKTNRKIIDEENILSELFSFKINSIEKRDKVK